ncbi:hypothetical protein [Phenylobacterium sp.]|uniref:hypothetical protein n=1 Tax=Phenylobacterium sp. TaxID=1871053 RepID=UPI002ED8F9CD
MKLIHLVTATAAVALLGGAAYAQQPQPQKGPTPGSVTGDWNGAHSPPDDKQYQEKVKVPIGEAPPADTTAAAPPATEPAPPAEDTSAIASTTPSTDVTAPAATTAASNVSVTTMTVTNGPVPDTPENRAKYGAPLSRAGKMTAARGN